jgi:hypothetical protein
MDSLKSYVWIYRARNFWGSNEVEYRWKRKGPKLEVRSSGLDNSLEFTSNIFSKMYHASKDVSPEPLVRYHRNVLQNEPGSLDILDPSVMDTLDHVLSE